MADYHDIRNKLMHSNGTSPVETFLAIVPSFFHTFIATTLASLVLSFMALSTIRRFLLEFALLIIPLVLDMTVFSKYVHSLLFYLITISITLVIFVYSLNRTRKKVIIDRNQNDFVTNARSTINVLSVIAILAVDFSVFPRNHTKTLTYGCSLMDMGVGLYVFSNGIVAPEVANKKDSVKKSIVSSMPLLILGVARFFVTKEIDYHVPVSEYGVHWNFFITLGLTKIFTSLLLSSIKVKYLYINTILLMISHEVFLQCALKEFVMKDIKRDSLILANKEGLVSCLGYVSLYLMSVYCGYILNLRNSYIRKENSNTKSKTLIKFTIISLVSLGVSLILHRQFGISRRLANSAYCFWVLFIGIFMTGLFYLAELLQRYIFRDKLIHSLFTPFIFEAINYNGLAFFLASNVMTGLINVLCDTLKVGTLNSIIIIVTYMFINCSIICLLFVRQIKVKL